MTTSLIPRHSDGVTLIDRPEISSGIANNTYTISVWESLDLQTRLLKVIQLVAYGEVIDLEGRRLTVLNLPGRTIESVVLFDTERNQVFAGDFVYRHLGDIIAFTPSADLVAYKTNSSVVATD